VDDHPTYHLIVENIAMENGPFLWDKNHDLPIKNGGSFQFATSNNHTVVNIAMEKPL
jgi:hypothetical protein